MTESNKLNDASLDHLLQLVAEGDSPKEITKALQDKYGVSITVDGVNYHIYREEKRILQKRRALQDQLDRIAASSKFVRLKRLEKQGHRIKETAFRTGKEGEIEDHKTRERLLIEVSEQQRKEVDGFKGIGSFEGTDPFAVLGVVSLGDLNKAIDKASLEEHKEDTRAALEGRTVKPAKVAETEKETE